MITTQTHDEDSRMPIGHLAQGAVRQGGALRDLDLLRTEAEERKIVEIEDGWGCRRGSERHAIRLIWRLGYIGSRALDAIEPTGLVDPRDDAQPWTDSAGSEHHDQVGVVLFGRCN